MEVYLTLYKKVGEYFCRRNENFILLVEFLDLGVPAGSRTRPPSALLRARLFGSVASRLLATLVLSVRPNAARATLEHSQSSYYSLRQKKGSSPARCPQSGTTSDIAAFVRFAHSLARFARSLSRRVASWQGDALRAWPCHQCAHWWWTSLTRPPHRSLAARCHSLPHSYGRVPVLAWGSWTHPRGPRPRPAPPPLPHFGHGLGVMLLRGLAALPLVPPCPRSLA